MNSILFLIELSLVMKDGLFRITSLEKDQDPSVMNHHKQHRKLNCIKKDVWWDWKGEIFFELLPRNQAIFACLMSSAEQIERSDQRKTARVGQS